MRVSIRAGCSPVQSCRACRPHALYKTPSIRHHERRHHNNCPLPVAPRLAMSSGQSVGGDSGDAMSRAVDAYDQGELDASRVLCEQQLRVEPSNAVALMLLGLIAKRGLQVEDAIPLLERSVRIAPNRKSLTSLADCYLRVGRLKQGLHYIDQVLAGNTDNLEALLIKAAILHGQQKFDDALACIDDAARLAPE